MSAKKILCLHGFVQNGSQFAKKASGVRKALKKVGYETIFLTAPVKVELADLPFDVNVNSLGGSTEASSSEADSMRSWWPNSESNPNYYSLDEAFNAVKESIVKDGPYDGVLGFSQGAGFAGVLCKNMHTLHESQPPLKFAIFYAGFKLKPPQHQHFYDTKIQTPSLHITGSLDTVVAEDRTKPFYEAFDESNRTYIVHPGGHFVPNSKDMVSQLVNWVKSHEEQQQESSIAQSNGKSEEKESWDEFDKIGR